MNNALSRKKVIIACTVLAAVLCTFCIFIAGSESSVTGIELTFAETSSEFATMEYTCDWCKGTGHFSFESECSACSGAGRIGDITICVGCNGNGTITSSCDSCGGSGMVETPCSVCGGSGMISGGMDEEGNPIEEPCGCGGGMVSDTCGGCAGAGSFSETCGGCSGNGLIDERPTCEECSGIGKFETEFSCSSCSGTGSKSYNLINSVRLVATVKPADAINKLVNWTAVWVNPESEWATGKSVTDYVTLTPTADGALTLDITPKQAFGEKIKVKAVSRDNSSVYAETELHFSARLSDVKVLAKVEGNLHKGLSSASKLLPVTDQIVFTFTENFHKIPWTVGTASEFLGSLDYWVSGNNDLPYSLAMALSLTDSFIEALPSEIDGTARPDFTSKSFFEEGSLGTDGANTSLYALFTSGVEFKTKLRPIIKFLSSGSGYADKLTDAQIYSALQAVQSLGMMKINLNYSSNNKALEYSTEKVFTLDPSFFATSVSSVETYKSVIYL